MLQILFLMLFNFKFFHLIYFYFTCMYVHHMNAGFACGALDPLDLELKVVVFCDVGTGNQSWVL